LNASDPLADQVPTIAGEREAEMQRAWTRHGLNSGLIFSLTCFGVSRLPRRVSYALGDGGTWLAWRLMRSTREAVVDNLRAIFPDDPDGTLRRRALLTFRDYARDVVDFLSALRAPDDELREMFQFKPEDQALFDNLLAKGRGIILVSGHYGNWEVGGVFLRRVIDLPVTIVAMTEASAKVNEIRRGIRERLGADTIEVRKSLETPLQIRRHLADNRVVAMLMDRHVGRDRVDVNLLGRRAGFLRTPSLMGFLTGAPVLPCFIERSGPGRFVVSAGTPIVVGAGLPRDAAIQGAAQDFADQLDARIRAHPSYWYHFYSYWHAQRDTADRAD
jgi:lauroyl/myristoyl acyltransferase